MFSQTSIMYAITSNAKYSLLLSYTAELDRARATLNLHFKKIFLPKDESECGGLMSQEPR